jgi:hypothetical protein
MALGVFKGIYVAFWKGLNVLIEWHKLPKWLGVFNLLALRYELVSDAIFDSMSGSFLTDPTPNSVTRISSTRTLVMKTKGH